RTAAYGKLHLPCEPHNWIAGDLDEFGDAYEMPDGTIGDSLFLRDLESKGLRHLEDSWHNPNHYGKKNISIDACPSELPLEDTMEMWCVQKACTFMENSGS